MNGNLKNILNVSYSQYCLDITMSDICQLIQEYDIPDSRDNVAQAWTWLAWYSPSGPLQCCVSSSMAEPALAAGGERQKDKKTKRQNVRIKRTDEIKRWWAVSWWAPSSSASSPPSSLRTRPLQTMTAQGWGTQFNTAFFVINILLKMYRTGLRVSQLLLRCFF